MRRAGVGLFRGANGEATDFIICWRCFRESGAGWLDIKVGDLLLTATEVLAAKMVLGFLSPRSPWRWVVLVECSCR